MSNQKLPIKNKTLLQILSFLAAVVLWFVITYTEDPVITISLNNIPIVLSNETDLHEKNLVFTNSDELPNISINVRGKRSDLRSILNSVSAKIDISDITTAGEYTKNLTYDIPNPSVMITKHRTESVNIVIEDEIEKEIPVNVVQTGTNDKLIKSTPLYKTITISGSSVDISRIKEALISLDISDIHKDTSSSCQVILSDEEHTPVKMINSVFTNISKIDISNTVYDKKQAVIALNPDLQTDSHKVSVQGFSKNEIEIGIRPGSEKNYETIYVDFSNNSISNYKNEYKMIPIIPDDVYCPTANEEIIMIADIENISTETISVKININNLAEGKTASLSYETITVSVTGPEEKKDKIKASVDASGLTDGTHTLPVKFDTVDKINILGNYTVNITIQ